MYFGGSWIPPRAPRRPRAAQKIQIIDLILYITVVGVDVQRSSHVAAPRLPEAHRHSVDSYRRSLCLPDWRCLASVADCAAALRSRLCATLSLAGTSRQCVPITIDIFLTRSQPPLAGITVSREPRPGALASDAPL